jgi:hypothetical protein
MLKPDRTLAIHELAPFLSHDDHNAYDVKVCLQKLQLTYLTY